MTTFSTRFTRALNIRYPIVSAPMAFAGGGALAAAVTRAGGLGLIGGGYGDPAWIEDQFDSAGDQRVGVGFITWSLRKSPTLLTDALKHRPAAVMLSFGDPRPFVDDIRGAGTVMICQCQNMEHVQDAVDVGAEVVVAQGAEAGGHGALRGTLSFVPEVADFLAKNSSDTLLLAAGGIADGRGLAAALMLGADGVLVGHAPLGIERSTGEGAAPQCYPRSERRRYAAHKGGGHRPADSLAAGVHRADSSQCFHDRWHGREDELEANLAIEGPRYRQPSRKATLTIRASGLAKRPALSTRSSQQLSSSNEWWQKPLFTLRVAAAQRSPETRIGMLKRSCHARLRDRARRPERVMWASLPCHTRPSDCPLACHETAQAARVAGVEPVDLGRQSIYFRSSELSVWFRRG